MIYARKSWKSSEAISAVASALILLSVVACKGKTSEQVVDGNTTSSTPSTAVQVPASLPRASSAAKAPHGSWRTHIRKNPITGEVSGSVTSSSRKAMYNGFSFEPVTLDIECSKGSDPSLGFFGGKLLSLRATDGNHYLGPIKIDDTVIQMDWYVSSEGDVMTDNRDSTDSVVQKLQMAKTVIVSYRGLESGEQFATFDLTGIRTAMGKVGCPTLTSE